MEILAHILLSIVGSAVIAGIIKVICDVTHHDAEYVTLWAIVFCAWWGIVFIGDC